jgi:hypothetical protein
MTTYEKMEQQANDMVVAASQATCPRMAAMWQRNAQAIKRRSWRLRIEDAERSVNDLEYHLGALMQEAKIQLMASMVEDRLL